MIRIESESDHKPTQCCLCSSEAVAIWNSSRISGSIRPIPVGGIWLSGLSCDTMWVGG
jgi:hypothetical protein